MMRGLKFVAKALEAAGHIVVEWQGPFRYETTDKLMADFWVADGGEGGTFFVFAHMHPLTTCSQEGTRSVWGAGIRRYCGSIWDRASASNSQTLCGRALGHAG
jgi:hypothetical protein